MAIASRALILAGLVLAAGLAEAQQKNTVGGHAQIPAPTAGEQIPAAFSEGMLIAADPQSIVEALQTLGHTATLGVDKVGDPTISSEIEGTQYGIYFYGCVEHANCQYLHFQAGWDLPDGWTLEAANQWNAGTIVTDAALDAEMDPILEYFVTTTGGLNQANFADAVDWWRLMLSDFKKAIGA